MSDESFSGAAMIIWLQDGRLKHRFFSDQKSWETELDRLEKILPSRLIWTGVLDWETKHIYYTDIDGELKKDGPIN